MAAETETLTFRALREDEMEKWLDHLAAAFAEKGTPREYFQGHYDRDPWRDIEGIRVCVNERDEILSTARVFLRRMNVNGVPTTFGGIGEVATSKSQRGKGLAPLVLQDAVAFMEQRGLALAVLHTSQAPLQQYYAKHGFTTVRMPFVRCASGKQLLSSLGAGLSASGVKAERVLPSCDDATLAGLDAIYTENARRFNGCVVRDDRVYWQRWVLEDCVAQSTSFWALRHEGALVAYMAVRVRTNTATKEQTLELREMFSAGGAQNQAHFEALLLAALEHHAALLAEDLKVVAHEGMVPRSWIPSSSVEEFTDDGWMYRSLKTSPCADVNDLLLGTEREKAASHLLASLDSF